MKSGPLAAVVLLALSATGGGADPPMRVSVSKTPPLAGGIDHYTHNRAPLTPSPLAKLPIGAIRPEGWMREQLRLMADGMVGHLPEVSHWCHSDSGWLTGEGPGWEELPYWLKGFTDLGFVLGDGRINAESRKWLDAILAHQEEGGWLGPLPNRDSNDLWPNMVALFALQALYEATGDPRVVPAMREYFQWQRANIGGLLPGSWQKIRAGDNVESVYWLYNRTGEPWLLDLARELHARAADWTHTLPTQHGVNICQGFREPGVFYQQSGDPFHLEATERVYSQVWGEYGRVPGGMFAADENFRDGKTGPQFAAETCSIVEFMYSCESLLGITGDPKWADRCEDAALNSFPAAYTPDFRGIHYLTAPNLVLCDAGPSHEFQNQGFMVAYSPGEAYRCCQHNVAQGWPYYAEHLWMATQGNGIAAVLYAPSRVRAQVAGGTEVEIVEETDYPFGGTVRLTMRSQGPVSFPLTLRIPGWCRGAAVRVDGEGTRTGLGPASWVTIEREWKPGDVVEVALPMAVTTTAWPKQLGAVSVRRGPLWYSLDIKEEWSRCGGTDAWPDWEVRPGSPWNYGLVVTGDPARDFGVEASGLSAAQPFTHEGTPVRMRAHARRIPEWALVNNTCGPLQQSPAATDQPEVDVTLIPMGCARLRVSVLPTVGGDGATKWVKGEQALPPGLSLAPSEAEGGLVNLVTDDAVGATASASYSLPTDPPSQAVDGVIGLDSAPHNRWTCWQSPNAEDWFEVKLAKPCTVHGLGLVIFDDQAGVWAPRSFDVRYWNGSDWARPSHEARQPATPTGRIENRVMFDPVVADRFRIVFQHRSKEENRFSGLTELLVWGKAP